MAELPLFIGSFSDRVATHSFDGDTGRVRFLGETTGLDQPAFLAPARDGQWLYAALEAPDGGLVALRRPAREAPPEIHQTLPLADGGACHVALDRAERLVFASHYARGAMTLVPRRADGSLNDAAPVRRVHEGSGPNPQRQEAPHPHCVQTDPADRWALCCDLGIDRVLAYRLDPDEPALELAPEGGARAHAGAGPRHMAFHAAHPWLYVANELDATVSFFSFDGRTGALAARQCIGLLPEELRGTSHAAEIRVHPSGGFLFASNRGHDSISSLRIASDGSLTRLDHAFTGGRPRHFAVDPSGRWLIAANRDRAALRVFAIDEATGALQPHGEAVETVAEPSCVCFGP